MRLLLLVAAVASLSLLASGCRHTCECKCQCVGSLPPTCQGGPSGLIDVPVECASIPVVKSVNECLAKAENDTQKGGCCHLLMQVPATPNARAALLKCVPYCAPTPAGP